MFDTRVLAGGGHRSCRLARRLGGDATPRQVGAGGGRMSERRIVGVKNCARLGFLLLVFEHQAIRRQGLEAELDTRTAESLQPNELQ